MIKQRNAFAVAAHFKNCAGPHKDKKEKKSFTRDFLQQAQEENQEAITIIPFFEEEEEIE